MSTQPDFFGEEHPVQIKDNAVLERACINKEKEIAELKVENIRLLDKTSRAISDGIKERNKLQSAHQAKIKELFQEIESHSVFNMDGTISVQEDWGWYKTLKSKYLQGKAK